MRMFIKLLCIIVHRIFLFGSFQFFILWFHWPWWKRTWTHHIRIINSRHLHPWDFSGNWLLTLDSLFCNSKMRKAELVSMQKKKKSGHTYLRVCRPEAFKAINNSVLLYLTLSLVKKKKKTIINSILNVSWKINFKCAAPQYNNSPSLPPHLHGVWPQKLWLISVQGRKGSI